MNKQGLWIDNQTFVDFSGDTSMTSLSKEIATRDKSIDFYNLGMSLPNPDPVLKKMGKDIQVYNELLVDARVGSGVMKRKAGTLCLNWSIDRGKSPSRQSKIIAKAFKKLSIYRILSEILNAPLFGNQVLEIKWATVDGLWMPIDVVGKPQSWFVFDTDNKLRMLTKTNMNPGELMPSINFLVAAHDATYENPYGFPLLSRCFWPVTFKKGGYKFWVTFLEKYGMPFLWGKLPRGLDKKEYEDLYGMLEKMVQDAVAVTPDDASISMVENKGSGSGSSDLFEKLMKYSDSQVSEAITGVTLTTDIGSSGSRAAAETHKDVADEIVWGDKHLCEQTMNTLIARICEFNFGPGEVPTFSLWRDEDVDTAQAERDGTLSEKCGVEFSPQYFQREYGFEDGDIVSVRKPQTAGDQSSAAVQFSEAPVGINKTISKQFPDQQAIDDAINSIPPEELQKQMEGMLKPIIDLINKGEDHNAVMEQLVTAYPDMDTTSLQEMLARAIFVCEVWGRLNADN